MTNKQYSLFNEKKYKLPKKSRELPLDIIYTFDNITDISVFLAFHAQWKIGIRSSTGNKKNQSVSPQVLARERWEWRFPITFIDNDYFNYNHEHHLSIVSMFKPKYATVCDVMTSEQCAKDNIKYYSLEQILNWAEQISEKAENVIVIPKYDCLDKIPEKFMLGYSVPTSHGGTPLPLKAFAGRRIHLLGGSWKKQLNALYELGDDIVSIDNNHIHKIAQYAQYCLPNGETETVSKVSRQANNPLSIALALSFGNIAYKVTELFKKDEG